MISHVAFHSLPVTDQDRALAFWRDVMGFTVTTDADYMPGQRWIMLRPSSGRTQLHLDLVDKIPEQAKPAIPLIATDVAGMFNSVRDSGAKIHSEPQPAPWDASTTFAMFYDSEGNLILISDQ